MCLYGNLFHDPVKHLINTIVSSKDLKSFTINNEYNVQFILLVNINNKFLLLSLLG